MQNLTNETIRSHQAFIRENIANLNQKKIMVVGDVCLDEYILGEVKRISPEAPVPVVEVENTEKRIGLAANVAQNVASLGGEPVLVGVIGNDGTGKDLKALLSEAGVSSDYLIEDSSRPTTCKTRIMTGNHHIVRVDNEHKRFLSPEAEEKLLATVSANIATCEALIIEDYAKGVFSESGTKKIIEMAHEAGKKVAVDPHRTTPVEYYKGADLFKPNRDEAFILSGLNLDELRENKDSVLEVSQSLLQKVNCQNLVITMGKDGMGLFSADEGKILPTYARQVFDVTGAGDTVIAAMTLAWSSGFSLEQACVLANLAAGFAVSQVGCVSCSQKDLLAHLDTVERSSKS